MQEWHLYWEMIHALPQWPTLCLTIRALFLVTLSPGVNFIKMLRTLAAKRDTDVHVFIETEQDLNRDLNLQNNDSDINLFHTGET